MSSPREHEEEPISEAHLDPRAPFAPSPAVAGDRLVALYEVGRQLLDQKAPSEVIETVRRAIVAHLRPDLACILACGADGFYRALATHNIDCSGPPEAWPLSRTVLGRTRESGLAFLASTGESDATFDAARSVIRYRIRSVMCVPIAKPARGLVYVDRRRDQGAFTVDDLQFLSAISIYAASALERAEELERTSAALALSHERVDVLQGELLRHEIVGRSPALLAAYDALRRFARTGARVLVHGETGTGKELFARAYAASSSRSGRAYVPVPVPALAPGLVESEIFGHVRGAFTEASRDKKGRLELADGGVLFLDEVGDIEPAVQTKLLRFLDSGELFRVGDTERRRVDALIVSATNRPLEKDLESGRLRADFLARLGHVVHVPPLRERREDIPLLARHFLEVYDRGSPRKVFSPEALSAMQAYSWPFNVRELQQVVERAVCLVDRGVIGLEDLPEAIARSGSPPAPGGVDEAWEPEPLKLVVDRAERAHILRILAFTEGNRRRAIELLQVAPETFYRRLAEFGLRTKDG
jgi:transcriptional regulator with GAF, ATPase, and Fis domain